MPHLLLRRPPGAPAARRSAIALLLLAAAACGGDGATPPPDETLAIQALTGTAPAGPAGSRLLLAPLALVTDAAGEPASGAQVRLTLVGGSTPATAPTLPETRVVSGPDGVVRADVVLGAVGAAQIRLAVDGVGENNATVVTVTATEPPTVTGVAPAAFGAGDEVTVTGTNLTSEEQGLAVTIGGLRATVLASTPTSVRVRAPACVAGGPVPVAVTTGPGVVAGAATATYTAGGAAPSLGVFEGVTVPAERAAECLSLLGGGARYLVVPQFATRDDVGGALLAAPSVQFAIGAPSFGTVAALMPAPLAAPLAPQQRLDRRLRARERALAPLGAAQGANPAVDVPPLAALTPNSTRTFQVLDDLDGDTYTRVTARLRFLGSNVAVYVDENAPANGLTQPQLDGLGRLFDLKLYPAVVGAFGSETDIDNNDRTIVLMSPVVNRLVSATECAQFNSYVTGFFYGLDLLPTQRNSNQGEIFYALVPDPSGATGSCSHSVNEVLRVVPATFVHEFQHMISWGQKVLVRGSPVDEALWLNEGLSHIAEEVASMIYERECEGRTTLPCRSTPEQIFPDSAQGFISGNFTNAYAYLEGSTLTSLTLAPDDGSLAERGAAFLFLRWLGDQKGEQIYRRLVETRETGVANVEDKAGEPWARMFGDFSAAVYAADRLPEANPSAVPRRYRFESRDLRRIFKRFYDTQTDGVSRPFPIVAPSLEPNGTATNAMRPGTMTWYTVSTGPGLDRTRITFQPLAGTAFPAALGAQVTILRLPD